MPTAATTENLAHYAANPQALAELTEDQIDALANQSTEPPVEKHGETTSSEPPVAASQPAEKPTEAPTETPEPAKVVQGKDGKAIIPYSVLERERERAARAEATTQALSEEIERLRAGGSPSDVVQFSEEDLSQLDQDLPGVAKAIRAQQAMIQQLTGAVQTLKRGQEVTERSAEQVRKDEEAAVIGSSPTLSALQAAVASNDPKAVARWNRIADTYESMRGDPEFEALDTAALIGKAEAAVTALYGPMVAPQVASPKETPEALKAKADAAVAAAAQAKAVPLSSGDIPGGNAPPVDEIAAMSEKSGAQLTAEFMNMSMDQIEAKLNRLR